MAIFEIVPPSYGAVGSRFSLIVFELECPVALVEKQVSVVVSNDGPYIVSGHVPLADEVIDANADRETVALRCMSTRVISTR